MTGRPRTPNEDQPEEAPQPQQQMQDASNQVGEETNPDGDDDDGTTFANINP